MKRHILLICSIVLVCSTATIGQDSLKPFPHLDDTLMKGKVKVVQTKGTTKLLETDKAINDSLKTIKGFRVQIYFGTGGKGRSEAKEIMEEFVENHPDIKVYDPVEFPNFKVRVGNCRSQLEAAKLKDYLKSEYPHAYIVKEDIELPSLDQAIWQMANADGAEEQPTKKGSKKKGE